MSKIQFNQLNQEASELNTLSKEETAEVVGGYYYPKYSYSYSSYSYSDDDYASVYQNNNSYVQQTALGGYGLTLNDNYTSQGNSANIYQ